MLIKFQMHRTGNGMGYPRPLSQIFWFIMIAITSSYYAYGNILLFEGWLGPPEGWVTGNSAYNQWVIQSPGRLPYAFATHDASCLRLRVNDQRGSHPNSPLKYKMTKGQYTDVSLALWTKISGGERPVAIAPIPFPVPCIRNLIYYVKNMTLGHGGEIGMNDETIHPSCLPLKQVGSTTF